MWLYAEAIVLQRCCIDYPVAMHFLFQLSTDTVSHTNVYEGHAIQVTDFWGKAL